MLARSITRLTWASLLLAAAAYACGNDGTEAEASLPDGGAPGDGGSAANGDGGTPPAPQDKDAGADARPPQTLEEGGTVTIDWLRGNEWGRRVFRQNDGKYLVVSRSDYQSALIVARFTAEGMLDTTYGPSGTGFSSPFVDRIMYAGSNAWASLLLPDGKLLLGALASPNVPPDGTTMAILRLTSDGVLDETFGNRGVAFPMFGDPLALAMQSDGKIIVAGTLFGGFGGSGLARLTAAGALDTTFGNGGRISGTMGVARGLAVDGADNIVMAGSWSGATWRVARFSPDGALDQAGFGVQGIATTDTTSSSVPYSVAFGPGGTIIVGGAAGTSGVLARYTSAGLPDTSFDDDGVVVNAGQWFFGIAVQPDGKILTSRQGLVPAKSSVHRYLVDGRLDDGFGVGGIAADGLEASFDVIVEPSGDVIVSGNQQVRPFDVNGAGLAITKLSPTGQKVTTFGPNGNGMAKSDGVMSADEEGRALAVQADGSIWVGGPGTQGAVVRFSSKGAVEIPPVLLQFGPEALALDAENRLYAAGDRRVARVLPTGKVDSTFTSVSFSSIQRAHGVVLHPSGKVITIGSGNGMVAASTNNAGSDLTEAVYTPIAFDGGAYSQIAGAEGAALLPDGHLVLGGWASLAPNVKRDAAFVRIDDALVADTTWQPGGALVLDLTPAAFENVHAVVALPDGGFVAAGIAGDKHVDMDAPSPGRSAQSVAFVVRIRPDGTPDPAFGTAGVWSSSLGKNVAGAFGLALQPDGRLVVAATRFDGIRDEGVLVGLTAGGIEDDAFGPGGLRLFSYGASSRLHAVAIEASGSILATGSAYTGPGGYDLSLTRF